jgi:hypothetical protein
MVVESHVWMSAPRGGNRGPPGFANAKCWHGKAPAGYSVTLYKNPPGGLFIE